MLTPAPPSYLGLLCCAALLAVMTVSRCSAQCGHALPAANGTTTHLQQIFMGRCYEFQHLVCPREEADFKNCVELYELFVGSFAYIDPCDIFAENYTAYVDAVTNGEPSFVDKTMLWSSGLYEVSTEYSARRRRVVTLAYTLMGYLVNQLEWCGMTTEDPASNGINYDFCPLYTELECEHGNDYGIAFWKQASIKFAQRAEGYVRVLLDSTRVFSTTSLFYTAELPNLDPNKVTKVDLLLARRPNLDVLETCESENIVEVMTLARDRGLTTNCIEDPKDIQYLLCIDWPDNEFCVDFFDVDDTSRAPANFACVLLHISASVLLFLISKLLTC